MASDADLVAGMLLALVLLIVVACVWPGLARVRGRDLAGYWAAADGALYEIRDAGGRAFTVSAPASQQRERPSKRGRPSSESAPASGGARALHGAATGVRGVSIVGGTAGAALTGRLDLGGRLISWRGAPGGTWTRQGVRAGPS